MAVTIQHLLQDQLPLVSISPTATLQEALSRMVEHDFSQLPVLETGSAVVKTAQFVTANSIARALRVFGTSLDLLRVQDAVVPARTVLADEDLFSKMDDLLDSYAVLVLHQDGTLLGIVTNYDTTQYFRRRAEDMLLVEDIETTLKDHVRLAFEAKGPDPEEPLRNAIARLSTPSDTLRRDSRKSFRRFCSQHNISVTDADATEFVDRAFVSVSGRARAFDQLNLSEYIQLAQQGWDTLGPVLGISQEAFTRMLDGVRETRNKLMHFRPDVDNLERDHLRFCAEWFKNHPPVAVVPHDGDAATPIAVPGDEGEPVLPSDAIDYVSDSAEEEDSVAPEIQTIQSKYAPLAAYLASQPRSQERLTLTFSEVEQIIGAPLPASAREHRAWWANDATMHVQSGQWLKVNWRVVSINMSLERVVFARARDRERAYIDFFGSVQNRLREKADFPLHEINPIGINWLSLARYPERGMSLVLSFARGRRVRLECYIDTGDAQENEHTFDALLSRQDIIESAVGAPLTWERLSDKRACRVALYTEGLINGEPEQLNRLVEWVMEYAPRFDRALRDAISEQDGGGGRTDVSAALAAPRGGNPSSRGD